MYISYNRYSIVFGHFGLYVGSEILRYPRVHQLDAPFWLLFFFQTYKCKNKKHIFFIHINGNKGLGAQVAYMQNMGSLMFHISTSS